MERLLEDVCVTCSNQGGAILYGVRSLMVKRQLEIVINRNAEILQCLLRFDKSHSMMGSCPSDLMN